MRAHEPVTERAKTGSEIGKYYCPEAYGFGKEMSALKNGGKNISSRNASHTIAKTIKPIASKAAVK